MEKYPHVGNLAVIIRQKSLKNGNNLNGRKQILLGLKWPKRKKDEQRKRKKIGTSRWIMSGGGTETGDKSQKHSVQREVWEESRLRIPLSGFKKVVTLRSNVLPTRRPLWLVHIYMVRVIGNPLVVPDRGTYEKMKWFSLHYLPANMFPTDRKWLKRLLIGHKLSIEILFTDETLKSTKLSRIKQVWGFGGRK